MTDPVNEYLDDLIRGVQSSFHACLLAQTTLQLGGGLLDNIQDDSIVEATVGISLQIEPIPIRELRQHRSTFPAFVLEVFQGKVVQLWSDCLSRIFEYYLELHLSGARAFVELKLRDVRIDFASSEPISEQLRRAAVREFDFREYGERQKLIDKLRNPAGAQADALRGVHKHVQIRNCIQHRNGTLDNFAVKKLGCAEFTILDASGTAQQVKPGEQIHLSIPEFDYFRKSLLLVGQAWRNA